MHRYSIIVKSLFIQRHCRAALPCAGWKIVAISVTAWWCHQMETFSALLAFCVGNSPSTGEFPAQRPMTQSFDIFFDLRLNKRLSKQSWGWWIKAPSRSLWGHCDGQSAGLMITCSTKCYDQDLSTVHMIYATNFRVFFFCFGVLEMSMIMILIQTAVKITSIYGMWKHTLFGIKITVVVPATKTERSSVWGPWYSQEKLAFNVPSEC